MEDAFIYMICYTLYFNVHITFGFGLIIYIKTNHHEAVEDVTSREIPAYRMNHIRYIKISMPILPSTRVSMYFATIFVLLFILRVLQYNKLILFGHLKHLYITVSVYLLGLLLPSWPDLS